MLLIPYQVDVRLARWPVSNYLVIALAVAAFCGQCAYPEDSWADYVLEDMNPLDWLGHVFLQPDILHLIGNMLFSGFLVTPSVQNEKFALPDHLPGHGRIVRGEPSAV